MPEEPAFAKTETTASAETPAGDEASQTRATTVQKVETPPPTRSWEAQTIIGVMVCFFSLAFLFYIGTQKVYDREVALLVTPILGSALMVVIGWYFGSSLSSSRKTEGQAVQMSAMQTQIEKLTNGVAH